MDQLRHSHLKNKKTFAATLLQETKQARNPGTVEKRIANCGGRTVGTNGFDGIDGIDGIDGTEAWN